MDKKNKDNWETKSNPEQDDSKLVHRPYAEDVIGIEDDQEEFEFDDMEDDDLPRARPWWLRLVALVTMLAFAGLVIFTAWPVLHLPIPEALVKYMLTEKDVDVKRLEQAVVQVKSLSRQQGSLVMEQKSGTGFNIDPTGIVITNHHVIAESVNMTLTFPDGKIYKAVSWASDPQVDLAVIKLQAKDLPTIPVNYNERPAPGDKIRVVGNPLGLNNIVVEGKVEQYYRTKNSLTEVFVIDAPVYPGNSGSPVFDNEGQVVGVVFASLSQDDREYPPGLVVPIKEALQLQNQQPN